MSTAGGVNIYECVSLLAPECAVCLSVCVCVCLCVFVCVNVCAISNQSTSRKPYVSGLSKLDTLVHKTYIRVLLVLSYQGLTCVDP